MKILVPVKRVVDPKIRVHVRPDKSGVVLDNMKMSMNPFDEVALEAAVQLFEEGKAAEIVVVSIGSKKTKDILLQALAAGAHRAIFIESVDGIESFSIAKILHHIVGKEQPSLVLTGKQSIDTDAGQTGPMLAALLNIAQGSFVSGIILEKDHVVVTSEIEGGTENLRLSLPAVLTVDLNCCAPRYLSLPNIMRARQQKIEEYRLEDLGLDIESGLEVVGVEEHVTSRAALRLDSLQEFIEKVKYDVTQSLAEK